MINVVVPMAGLGSRFGPQYRVPKAFIEVEPGRPMVSYAVEFLRLAEPHRFIFVGRAEHDRQFGLRDRLSRISENSEVVLVEELTSGPASTVLRAAEFIDNDEELIVAYCDNFITIDFNDVLASARGAVAAGAVITHTSTGARHSYAALDRDDRVLRPAEKQVISSHATVGFYYFRAGCDYVAAARRMIDKGGPGRREDFVCPVYNELIGAGGTVVAFPIPGDSFFDMGTPDDLADVRRRLAALPRPQTAASA